jgi:hypothetical protein
MEAIDLAELYGVNYEVRGEEFKPFPRKETEEGYLDNYDEPMYFFKGSLIGFFFCLPFWTILIWLIT